MTPARTLEGKDVLYLRATGQRHDRWPVDARAMLATGAYTADPSDLGLSAPPAPASAPSEPSSLPTEHALGGPLIVTKSEDAQPGKPTRLPAGRSPGRQARR